MNNEVTQQLAVISDQIRKGFAANERQQRVLKTRMAKLELELKNLKKATNQNTLEILGLKSNR